MKLLKFILLLCCVASVSCAAGISNEGNKQEKKLSHIHDVSDKKGGFCIWLITGDKTYNILQNIITGIAKIQDTPTFKPHLTLFCGNSSNIVAVKDQFKKLYSGTKRFDINIGKPVRGNDVLRKLNLPVSLNQSLKDLHVKAVSLDSDSDYNFVPHISLFFGKSIPSNIIDIPKKYLYEINNPVIKKIALVEKGCSFRDYDCVEKSGHIVSKIDLVA